MTDSTGATLKHSQRVGELMGEMIHEAIDRSYRHDRSKTEDPELAYFDESTEKLKTLTYGSDEYKQSLADIKPALDHHYANNRHHPEYYQNGVAGMSLVDLIEMLADWKAATERTKDGSLKNSLDIQADRFHLDDISVFEILWNTAVKYGWL